MRALLKNAGSFGENTAVVVEDQRFPFRTLLEKSETVASALLGSKLDLAEARVAFMVRPGFEYVAAQWGIWRAGGVAVPLCVDHPPPALQHIILDARVSMVVCDDEFFDILKPLALEANARIISVKECLDSSLKTLPNVSPDRRAMMLYTSGSTSLPKGVVTTHANIEAQIKTLVEAWEWRADDHILCTLPLHHIHGVINVVSCALWSGACVEFLPKFEPQAVFEKFLFGKVNLFMAVPTIYFKLIHHYESLPAAEQREISQALRRFRLMVSGSAALPVSVLEKWREISGHTLLERYGMTEIGMALSNPYHGERRAGFVGQPLPSVEVRLVDESGQDVPEGAQGEIWVKGPSVFCEYWGQPDATRESFVEGWFRTGDVAIRENGSYRILGRLSVDIIKSGGYKISALEIEEVLLRHPGIQECAVIGVPDDEWGEVVAAGIVPAAGDLRAEEIAIWAKQRLPKYKIPRKIIFRQSLPRNAMGKVTKNVLKEMF